MRASHVDRRSKRYAARQFVSDSHDHKPDAAPKKRKEPATSGEALPAEKLDASNDG